MLIHLLGIAIMTLWTLWQWVALRRAAGSAQQLSDGPSYDRFKNVCRQLGLKRPVRLLASRAVSVPLAFGLFRPTVMLPSTLPERLSPRDFDTVLAHELAHVRRRDAWMNWVQILVCAVWWFHPVVWLVSRAIKRVREDCCDDLLLARGLTTESAYCDTLIRIAKELVPRSSTGMALGMAERLSSLGQRVRRIMDQRVRRSAGLSTPGILIAALVAALALPGLDRAAEATAERDDQDPTPGATQPREDASRLVASAEVKLDPDDESSAGHHSPTVLSGTVEDAAGEPVPGAAVWLIRGPYSDMRILARAATDSQGRFSFRDVDGQELSDRGTTYVRVWVRDEKGRLGWSPRFTPTSSPYFKIRLQEVGEIRGRVVNGEGRPVVNALISPKSLNSHGSHTGMSDYMGLPSEISRNYQTTTDADGAFTLGDLPIRGSINATVSANGYGLIDVTWEPSREVTIPLERAGAIHGRFTGGSPDMLDQIKLDLYGTLAPPGLEDGPVRMAHRPDAIKPKPDGSFQFSALPPGTYQISPKIEPSVPFYAASLDTIEVKAGETVEGVAIELKPAIRVRGRVVDRESGGGIEDVGLWLYHGGDRRRRFLSSLSSDKDGRFTAYVPPGKLSVQPMPPPEYIVPPRAFHEPRKPPIDVTGEIDSHVIELDRAARLDGVVVSDEGQPIEGANVKFIISTSTGGYGYSSETLTDPAGRFSIPRLDPEDTFPIRARTDQATTDGAVVVVPGEIDGPLRLVVSETKAFWAHGRVVDATGRPIPAANVQVKWSRIVESKRSGMSGISSGLEHHLTDADGRFKTNALWPGDDYRVIVTAEGYGEVETAEVKGQTGQTHDFGDLVLPFTDGFVQGEVVDSSGQPLPGVRVFNHGDGPKRVSTRSDTTGRYRLEGLFGGPVYVFAEEEGYWFEGVRTRSGSRNVTIRLLRRDEAPARSEVAEATRPSFPEEVQVARPLLDRLWGLRKPRDHRRITSRAGEEFSRTNLHRLILCMARIDPSQALAWSDEFDGANDAAVRTAVAEQIAATDPEEALALLADVPIAEAFATLTLLARQLADSDPPTARRFAEEALQEARAADEPRRTSLLAQTASVVLQLGDRTTSGRLAEEAANAAAKMGGSGGEGDARGDSAVALAPFDLPRALELTESIATDRDRLRHLTNVAVALAPHDLDGARAVLGQLNDSGRADRAQIRIAYALAPADSARALAVAEEIDDAWYKVTALGWIAEAVAPREPQLAISLIDRCFEMLLDEEGEVMARRMYAYVGPLAARMAVLAKEIGYPNLDSIVQRVLAARATAGEGESPLELLESRVGMALTLSLYYPAAARDLLESVDHQSDLIGAGHSGMGDRRRWLQAWALVDLKRARGLFEEDLAEQENEPDFNMLGDGFLDMLDLLTVRHEDRPRHLLGSLNGVWVPGEE